MAGGWTGKYLLVDLTKLTWDVKELDMSNAEKYIGQRGLAVKMAIDLMPDPCIDALSPENPLVILNGPLTGLYGICNGRFEVVTKSPLTDALAGSNSGGFWGPELKYAGYDGVICIGKSEKPVYIWIENESVEIRDAAEIWGEDVFNTTHALKTKTDLEAKVLCIGQAGENLSRIAAIMNDMYRAAGRSGVGAVMGSKNLKAIVVRGTGELIVNEPFPYFKKVKECQKRMVEAGDTGGALTELGTPCLVNPVNESGSLGFRNFGNSSGYHPDYEKVSGENLKDEYLIKNKGCFGCPISCGRVSSVKTGNFKTPQGEGPEYETTWGFSANCGCFDLAAAIKANYLCNKYGLDTISMAGTVSCAMELYEKGYLNDMDNNGHSIAFGEAESMLQLIEDTALRKGLGDNAAEGSYRLATYFGHPECSVTVKKQELPGYDPRAGQGVGLAYATSNRGACHVRGNLTDPELTIHTIEQEVTEGKAEYTVEAQDLGTIYDSVGMCKFPEFTVSAADIAEMLSLATGIQYNEENLIKAARRIWTLEKMFNLKSGIKPEDDTLPERLLKVPLANGSMKGKVNLLDQMLPEYYKIRGWDRQGIPGKETLIYLDLTEENKVL